MPDGQPDGVVARPVDGVRVEQRGQPCKDGSACSGPSLKFIFKRKLDKWKRTITTTTGLIPRSLADGGRQKLIEHIVIATKELILSVVFGSTPPKLDLVPKLFSGKR